MRYEDACAVQGDDVTRECTKCEAETVHTTWLGGYPVHDVQLECAKCGRTTSES